MLKIELDNGKLYEISDSEIRNFFDEKEHINIYDGTINFKVCSLCVKEINGVHVKNPLKEFWARGIFTKLRETPTEKVFSRGGEIMSDGYKPQAFFIKLDYTNDQVYCLKGNSLLTKGDEWRFINPNYLVSSFNAIRNSNAIEIKNNRIYHVPL